MQKINAIVFIKKVHLFLQICIYNVLDIYFKNGCFSHPYN